MITGAQLNVKQHQRGHMGASGVAASTDQSTAPHTQIGCLSPQKEKAKAKQVGRD